jgi:hypothetical protein
VRVTKRYKTRRVLNNKVMNVLQAKLAYEVFMLLSREQLCETISRHVGSRLPFNSNPSRAEFLTEPHLMDINMAKLGLDSISVALHKAYSLGIVAPKSLLCLKREANVAIEAIPVLQLNTGSRERIELCFSGRSSN